MVVGPCALEQTQGWPGVRVVITRHESNNTCRHKIDERRVLERRFEFLPVGDTTTAKYT